MANHHAHGKIGNKGGRPYSFANREKSATLKGLCLDWAIKVMEGDDELLKKEVSLKILPTCIPRPIEVSGEDGEPLRISFDKVFYDSTREAEAGDSEQSEV